MIVCFLGEKHVQDISLGGLSFQAKQSTKTNQLSNEKKRGCLGYVRDYTTVTQLYIGTIISHYKDPYQTTSIMECHKGFERCSIWLPKTTRPETNS